MANNEILQFAETDKGTNLLTQAEYLADAQRPIGNQPGVARSKLVNKALRQSSLIAAAVAQFIADNQANNVVDTATPSTLADWIEAAVRSVGIPTAVAGGTADAITADFTPNVALTNGTTVIVRAGAANATTTPTFAPDGLTAKTIVKGNNFALVAGDIAGAGHWLEMNFDTVLDKWVLLNPATGISNAGNAGLFKKADSTTVAFTKTGAFTVSTSQAITVEVNGIVHNIAAATVVTMPGSPVSGTDYAVWATPGGTLEASANFTSPPVANSRKIGGFHYAPGGNAAAQTGGDTTPQINEYSFWDLKFRPASVDPRGMTLVAGGFWADIYLLGVDHLTNGTSKYNVTIADGSSPPKIPTKFGGNGTNAYASMNWWEANEVLQSYGKRSPTYDEFAALAYGTTEATASGGTDVPTTGATGTSATSAWNVFTSKWGCIQSSGCMWVWGGEFGGGAAAAGWTANTGGRGSTYQMENAVLFGGGWGNASDAGSRASLWSNSPTASMSLLGARGVCDHLQLD